MIEFHRIEPMGGGMGIRRWTRLVSFVVGVCACAALPGCSASTSAADGVVADAAGDAPDSPASAGDVPGDVPATSDVLDVPDGTACPLVMEFADPMDDPVHLVNLQMTWHDHRDMRVKVTACGAPATGRDVTFTIVKDVGDMCHLDLAEGPVDEDGMVSVVVASVVNGLSVNQCLGAGACTIEACAAPGTCVQFQVSVDSYGPGPLNVAFGTYEGAFPQLSLGKVKLFKQTSPDQFPCSSLKANALPTATMGMGPIDITSDATFTTMPGLETELTQTYTLVCTATEPGSTDIVKAWGCVDDVTVEWGKKQCVVCPLNDIPPKIVGGWDITTTLNLQSGLPPQVAMVLNFVIDLLNSPTAGILKMMCEPAIQGTNGGALQAMCGYVFTDPSQPDIANLTTIGEETRGIIDAYVKGILCWDPANPWACGDVVYDYGHDVGDIFRTFQVLSTMTCLKEPDASGLVAMGGCKEAWHTAVVHWMPGTTCWPPTTPSCGAVLLPLASMAGMEAAITADIEARMVDQNTKLAITRHAVGLKYGALIDHVIEKFLMPKLLGDGSDGLPPVDSFEAMIAVLLAGKQCLNTGSCCNDFATHLIAQSNGALTVNLVEGACDSLVTSGGPYIRKFLLDLDTPTSTFTVGTPVADGLRYLADQPCAIIDTNGDMKIDDLGKQPVDQQCVWDALFTVGGFNYSPYATFWGIRN